MKPRVLAFRGLGHYWRTHLAVVVGVAAAVAVLTGALLVGDSVRASLRNLVLTRIGATDHLIVSTGFFREALVEDVTGHPDFAGAFRAAAPLVAVDGVVTMQIGEGRASGVRVYGVDDRFWRFHGVDDVTGPAERDARLSPALAEALGAASGDTILVRVQRPTDVPIESVYGEKDDLGRTVRARVLGTLGADRMGEFSLAAQQGPVRAVFLPLGLLQEELETARRVNAILVSGGGADDDNARLEAIVRDRAAIADLGLDVRVAGAPPTVILEADDGLLDDGVVEAALDAANEIGAAPEPLFTYLANEIRIGEGSIPYSLVTALDLASIGMDGPDAEIPPIVLNRWAADDLQARLGDTVTLAYYAWEDPGRLVTRTMDFAMAGVVPIDAGDADMAPEYPGIVDSNALTDWDPPFPIDLGRIRPQDEDYWDAYRTTPKAFIPLATGTELWRSRYGSMTSIRLGVGADAAPEAYAAALAARLDPLSAGLTVAPVRSDGMESSRGAIDFGEYFVYFSFFLVASALMLAALFFKLGIEQRGREVGLLRAVGFTPAAVRRLFMKEGLWLAAAGTALGVAGGIAYAQLIVTGLGTWWVDAVGTRALEAAITPVSIVTGALGGLLAAAACIWITLGRLQRVSERGLLAGAIAPGAARGRGNPGARRAGGAFALAGFGLSAASAAGAVPDAGGFFGAGAAMLAAALCLLLDRFSRSGPRSITGTGWWTVARLGLRSVTHRPSRSVVSVGMIAAATFILISLDAFRKDRVEDAGPRTGIGGYSMIVESLLPIVTDAGGASGRAALGLDRFDDARVEPFRFRPGDDASCLNLYVPTNPRIIAPTDGFVERARFAFAGSLAEDDAERRNPWLLLRRRFEDGAVPVIADAHSIAYVLDTGLGEDIVIREGGREIRLRVVAALDDSIFQGELLMSEDRFVELFPDREGYPYLLVETREAEVADVAAAMERALEDFGAEATSTTARLAEFHRVENTYLSTFQALGGLGLLLGTVGLGAVLMRNVLERRKELALLRALGYRRPHFFAMTIAENAALLAAGLATGAGCALLAIAPAIAERGGRLPGGLLVILLCGVFAAGLITSLAATIAALRSPLLSALRTE